MIPNNERVNSSGSRLRISFRDRLEYVAGERKLTPFMKGLGWSTGTIDRVLNDPEYTPGPQMLQVLARVENVSLDWIMDSVGTPFRVSHLASDGEAAEYIAALREESSWRVHIYEHGGDTVVIVFSQPASITYKRHTVRYTCLEVVTGGIGPRALHALDGVTNVNAVSVDAISLQQLAQGWTAGTYWLTQAKAPPFDDMRPAPNRLTIAERAPAYGLSEDESAVVDRYRGLPDNAQSIIRQLLDVIDGN